MRKLWSVFFSTLAFLLSGIVLFASLILGTDLLNRYIEDHKKK